MTDFAKILELGGSLLAASNEQLVDLANDYNTELERMLSVVTAGGRDLSDAERELVARLMEQHARIVSRMESVRDSVGSQLRDVQKKTQAIRLYFDQQAPRGGFTGTKKG